MRLSTLLALVALAGCDTPSTNVVVDNRYPQASGLTVFRARWETAVFSTPIPPGTSSDPQASVPASANPAWVLLAHDFDAGGAPTELIVIESRAGFELHTDQTLHIPVDDANFAGNCAAGSPLTQTEADFLTQQVFADEFAGARYDAATCAVAR